MVTLICSWPKQKTNLVHISSSKDTTNFLADYHLPRSYLVHTDSHTSLPKLSPWIFTVAVIHAMHPSCCGYITYITWTIISLSALTLLVGWLEGHPACKNWVVRFWRGYLSGVSCKWFAYDPADAIATPSSLAPVKSRMVCLSGAGLPRLSWKKGR